MIKNLIRILEFMVHDNYHYLSGEEFFNLFQDRVPEDLQPRVEQILNSEREMEELESDYNSLERNYDSLERDYAEAQDLISELELEIKNLKTALIAKDEKLCKLRSMYVQL